MNSTPRNQNTAKRENRDTTQVTYPEGAVRITDDPYNPYGYIDPRTGHEIDARTGRPAWKWAEGMGGEGVVEDPKRKGMYRRYLTLPKEKQAVANEVGSALSSSGGAPVGGSAGSPGATGAVGDMQSTSGAAPTSYGLSSAPQAPMPQPSGAATPQAAARLPFTISTAPAVDAGSVQGAMSRSAMVAPAESAMTPEQWMRISRPPAYPQPLLQRPANMITPAEQAIRSQQLAPMATPQMPAAEQQLPWYQNLIRSIFG